MGTRTVLSILGAVAAGIIAAMVFDGGILIGAAAGAVGAAIGYLIGSAITGEKVEMT